MQSTYTDAIFTKVQLLISCRHLKDLDLMSKSDPICILYTKGDTKGAGWQKHGQTERIDDNLNPDFQTSFYINYYFEKNQPLKFEVIDDDGNGKAQLIGTSETTLGTIMGSRGQTFISDLHKSGNDKSRGKLIVRADSVKDSSWEAQISVEASNLPNRTSAFLCAANYPVLQIYRGSHTDP